MFIRKQRLVSRSVKILSDSLARSNRLCHSLWIYERDVTGYYCDDNLTFYESHFRFLLLSASSSHFSTLDLGKKQYQQKHILYIRKVTL